MGEKEIKLIQKILDKLNDHDEKFSKMESRLDILSKTAEYEQRALEVLEEKKKLTKRELLEELGLSYSSHRLWRAITNFLEKSEKVNIHQGTGRSQSFLVYLNNDSLLSKASKLFMELKKKRDYRLDFICERYRLDK